MVRTTVLVSVLALVLGGCGSPGASEPDDFIDFPDGKADSITPQGDLGYLVVKQPDLADGVTVAPYKVYYRNVEIEVGQKYRLKKGSGDLKIVETTHRGYSTIGVGIEAGKTVTYVIPFIVVTWDPAATRIDVGPKAQVQFQDKRTRRVVHTHYLDGASASPRGFPFVHSWYTTVISPAILAEAILGPELKQDLFLEQAMVEDLQVTKDVRAAVTFTAPVREAGDPEGLEGCMPPSSSTTYNCQAGHHWVVWRNQGTSSEYEPAYYQELLTKDVNEAGEYAGSSIYASERIRNLYHFQLTEGESVTAHMYKLPPDDPVRDYMYVTSNVPHWFNPDPGTLTIEGQHLDIFDAEVEENGAITTFPATYRIEWLCPSNVGVWWCNSTGRYQQLYLLAAYEGSRPGSTVATNVQRFNTPSGLDLPPGNYRITVDFNTDVGPLKRVYQCELLTPSVAGESRCKLVSES